MNSLTDTTAKSSSGSFDQMNPNDIQEFKPMNPGLVSLSCDYGSYPPHPHLYLYSPADNSLIPCEEIIIPNPVMSPEGPVYSGPTNIYLAYPVQGPDGKGYITQPFATPDSYSQDSASYSPSMSYDGSSYHSTTPQDSGTSTQPASPPPPATYHPTNWINQDLTPHVTEQFYDPQLMESCTDKSIPSVATTATGSPATSTTAAYIPGLSLDSKRTSSKKRRKKKKVSNSLEQRRSSSSESDNLKLEENARPENSESMHGKIGSEVVNIPEVIDEPIQEVYLTDDLADSLVNPPTDPEISDEDSQESISLLSTCTTIEACENKLGVAENEIEMAEEESNEIVTEVVHEIESEEQCMVDNVLRENDNIESTMEDIQHIGEKIETLEGEFNGNRKCDELCDVPVKKVEDRTETCNKVPERKKPRKKNRSRNHKEDSDCVLKSESKSQVLKSEDQSSSSQAMKKSYSSVIKSNITPTISCKPSVETVTVPSTQTQSSGVQGNNERDYEKWEKVSLRSLKP